MALNPAINGLVGRKGYQHQTTSQLLAILEHRDVPDLKAALIELLCFQDEEREHRRVHGVQFMDLPPELRVRVFECLTPEDGFGEGGTIPGLLQCSRQIRLEAQPVFYSMSTVHVCLLGPVVAGGTAADPSHEASALWDALHSRSVLHFVRHVRIFILFGNHQMFFGGRSFGYFHIHLSPDGQTYTSKCDITDPSSSSRVQLGSASSQKARVKAAVEELMAKVVLRGREEKWHSADMKELGWSIWSKRRPRQQPS